MRIQWAPRQELKDEMIQLFVNYLFIVIGVFFPLNANNHSSFCSNRLLLTHSLPFFLPVRLCSIKII